MIGDRWGVTEDEVARAFPCDELVTRPAMQVWRGVTVAAPPDRVWPWVAQIRLAPYSYDWIDNLGRRSPQRLRGLPEPVAGEPFTTAARLRLGQVLSADPGHQLTGQMAGVVMSYVLEPDGAGTRLLLKIVAPRWRLVAPVLSLGDLVMARRQLLNIKQLAEQTSRRAVT
jgi:hypothetical protein